MSEENGEQPQTEEGGETQEQHQPVETAASAYAVDDTTAAVVEPTGDETAAVTTDVAAGGVDDEGNPLRTLFMSGFPADVKKREIHNLFRFAPGFEAVSLNNRGRAPVAFATFMDQPTALAARSLIHGTRFDPEIPMDLRVDLAKTNSFGAGGKKRGADETSDGAGAGGGEKRARHESTPDPYARSSNEPKGITTLFVANLGMYSTEDELRQLFGILPGFRRLRFNQTKGAPVAFIDYTEVVYAQQAQQTYQGYKLPSSPSPTGLRIEFAKNNMGGPPDPPMKFPVAFHGAYAVPPGGFPQGAAPYNPYGGGAFPYPAYPGVGVPFTYDPNAQHHPYK